MGQRRHPRQSAGDSKPVRPLTGERDKFQNSNSNDPSWINPTDIKIWKLLSGIPSFMQTPGAKIPQTHPAASFRYRSI